LTTKLLYVLACQCLVDHAPGHRRRVEYELYVLVYKSLSSLRPLYLADDCQLVVEYQRRSSSHTLGWHTCVVSRTQSRFGDRSFNVAVLTCETVFHPSYISRTSNSDSLNDYLRHFWFCGCGALWLSFLPPCINSLTYLHTCLPCKPA